VENRYEYVFWVDASNKNTLEQSYKAIASKLGTITDLNFSLEVALRELQFFKGNWLLLVDGADNLEDISGLWPPGIHGDILYTSRNRMLRRLAGSQIRCVSEMNEDEASELLLKSAHLDMSPKSYEEQASDIVTELGYLALAIDQAGAYIANGECRIDDFLDTFNIHRQHLLQNEAYKGASGNERAVYATWDLSYTAIDRQAHSVANIALRQAPKAALQILQIFPFFHNEGIMEEIFRSAAENSGTQSDAACKAVDEFLPTLFCLRPDGGWESQNLSRGIQTLMSFSLIGQNDFQRHFYMHRLVHLWAFDRLTAVERDHFRNAARDVLTKSITWRFKTNDYTFRRDLLPHITALQRQTTLSSGPTKSQGLAKFALVFSEAGRWKEAEELEVRVVETTKRVLGEEHPDTLSSIANLAATYRNQGRWKEAEELQVRVMEARKRVSGEEHPDTLSSMANLASTYWNQGRWKEAEELQVRVMETTKRVLGKEHPDTLTSIANLASTYWIQSRWKEAEELEVQVIEVRKRVLGEEHPDTLSSMGNLASIYWNQGRWKEAEELQVRVMEARKRVSGEEHPDTLTSIANLAVTYRNQGRWKEAILLIKRCFELQNQLLGPAHPHTETSHKLLNDWKAGEHKVLVTLAPVKPW